MPPLSILSSVLFPLGSAFAVVVTAASGDYRTPVCNRHASCDVQCVDPGRYGASRSVVIDKTDGMLWQREVAIHASQKDALAYCETLDLGGMKDWRLPEAEELTELRYKAGGLFGGHAHYCVPSIDQAAFPATPAEPFWTARTGTDGTGWYLGFDDGRAHWAQDSEPFAVRCVHDAVVSSP